jgi:hypothetical protein
MEEQANAQEVRERLLDFFRALGSLDRLKIAGLLAQRQATVAELARTCGLRESDVARHLARLEGLGLVQPSADESALYRFDQGALIRLKREVFAGQKRPKRTPAEGEPAWEQKTLDTFVVDGRLMGIPAQHKRRVAVTKWLAAHFEPGVRYSEKEVNQAIERVHHDSSSLRRYMVDYGYMERDHGVYWRTSTPVE